VARLGRQPGEERRLDVDVRALQRPQDDRLADDRLEGFGEVFRDQAKRPRA